MRRIMVQEARLLNTEPSNHASTTAASVGNEQEDDDDNFFSFQSPQVTTSTVEDEVQRYLQDSEKTLASLKAYPVIRALFLKYNTTLPSSASVERLFSQGGLVFTPHRNHITDKHFEEVFLLRYNAATSLLDCRLNGTGIGRLLKISWSCLQIMHFHFFSHICILVCILKQHLTCLC